MCLCNASSSTACGRSCVNTPTERCAIVVYHHRPTRPSATTTPNTTSPRKIPPGHAKPSRRRPFSPASQCTSWALYSASICSATPKHSVHFCASTPCTECRALVEAARERLTENHIQIKCKQCALPRTTLYAQIKKRRTNGRHTRLASLNHDEYLQNN